MIDRAPLEPGANSSWRALPAVCMSVMAVLLLQVLMFGYGRDQAVFALV